MKDRYHDKPEFSSRDIHHPAYKTFVENLYKDQYEYFFKISYGILANTNDAEDAVAEAFYKISKNIELIFRIPCQERLAYCVRVVKNAAYDIIRSRKACLLDSNALDVALVSDTDVFLTIAEKLELEELTQLLNALNSVEFWLIHQRYMEEKSFREIGEILGIREEAARKRHQRILEKLRGLCEQKLEEKGGRTYGQK